MKKSTAKKDISLLYELGSLRNIDRTWKQFTGEGVANLAEHHFRVAWIALLIARKEERGDDATILKLAILHDVAESRTGDVNFVSRQYTDRREESAVRDIFSGTSLEKEMLSLFGQYEERASIESIIVKDADMIDVELELQEMSARGIEFVASWKEHRKKEVYPKLKTQSGRDLWDAIHSGVKPYSWHNDAIGNLFKKPDWFKKQNKKK